MSENGLSMIDLILTHLDHCNALLGSHMMDWCIEISSSDTFWPFPTCLKMTIWGEIGPRGTPGIVVMSKNQIDHIYTIFRHDMHNIVISTCFLVIFAL